MDSTPPPLPNSQPIARKRAGGCGCCAGGCFSIIVIGLVLIALLIGASVFFVGKALSAFTSDAPVVVQAAEPTAAQITAASAKVDQIRTAAHTQQQATVEFSADELNALIARHPSFEKLRGKVHVGMANSILNVEMSAPLTNLHWPGFKHRWFNGTARFGLAYDEDRFSLDVKSLEANGRTIDLSPLQRLADRINNSFNDRFERTQRHDRDSAEFWENVESMSVVGDKLIITTKGAQPDDDAEPEDESHPDSV